MQRLLIQSVNCALLSTLLLGIPAIAGIHLGSVQVSSISTTQRLMFWGLSLAAGINAGAGLGALKNSKNRRLCRYWTLAFLGLLGLEYALARGYLDFQWLQRTVQWLEKRF